MLPGKFSRRTRTAVLVALSCFTIFSVAGAPAVKAAGKDSVTVSVVLALAAGEWSTEFLPAPTRRPRTSAEKSKSACRGRQLSILSVKRKCFSRSSKPSPTS